MPHEKVYGFCENMCKVEVPAKDEVYSKSELDSKFPVKIFTITMGLPTSHNVPAGAAIILDFPAYLFNLNGQSKVDLNANHAVIITPNVEYSWNTNLSITASVNVTNTTSASGSFIECVVRNHGSSNASLSKDTPFSFVLFEFHN